MSDRSDDVAWHWLAPDGKPAQGSESELRDKLSKRGLPPSTRVWRSGWAEWLPANRTKELASSLPPGTKLTVREPRLDPTQLTPPDPKHTELLPLSTSPPRVAAVGPLRASKPPLPSGLSRAAGRTPANAPPTVPRLISAPPSQRAPLPSAPKPPVPPGPRSTSPGMAPPEPVRAGTATVRPPSAVPPPPRAPSGPVSHQPVSPPPRSSPAHAAPAPTVVVSGDAPARPLPEPPAPSHRTPPSAPAAAETRAAVPGSDDAEEVEADTIGAVLTDPPTHAPAASSLPPIPPNAALPNDLPLPSYPASDAAPPAVRFPPASLPPSIGPAASVGNLRAALVVVSLIAAALVLLLVLTWIFSGSPSDEEQAAASASAAARPLPPAASARETRGCTLAVPAAKLAASVERSTTPNLFNLEDGRVAVGFATKPTHASGIVVDVRTLDVQAVFDEPGTSAVRNVTPSAGNPASFAVDREDHPLSQARSVEPGSRTLLGFTKDGLARASGKSVSDELWKVATNKVTEARAARAGDSGFLVTFRRGGLSGDVLAGWISPNFAKQSELEVLPAGVRFVGTPAVAAHPNAALIAFAGRDDENADWRIRLARGEARQLPRAVSDFALPPGGPGGGAIAPWIAPLDQNRWLLQWTEGGTGQYQVRVQALSAELAPIGTPALASPKGASAGQGVVWLAGTRALSLFVLTVGGFDELWGAVLECH